MATETIRIIVTETGAKQTAASIKGIGTEASASAKALALLESAIGAVAGAAIIREYVILSSTYQQLQNRISLVTRSQQEQAAVTRELVQIADQSFAKFEDTAELYARLAFNTRDLNITQKDLLTITRAVSQSIVLSGANAREATAAMIQLSQGLASGTLRGDELRSVLEQLPFLADIIAKNFGLTQDQLLSGLKENANELVNQIGVSRGALRFLGAEGQITSEKITGILLKAAPGIQKSFDKLTPSIRQAFLILTNEIIGTVGEFDSATGAAAKFSEEIIALSTHVKVFVGIAAAVQDFFLAVGDGIKDLAKSSPELKAFLDLLASPFKNLKNETLAAVVFVAQALDALVGVVAGSIEAMISVWDTLPRSWKGVFTLAVNSVITLVELMTNSVVDSVNAVLDAINKITDTAGIAAIPLIDRLDLPRVKGEVGTKLEDIGKAAADGFARGFKSTTTAFDVVNDVLNKLQDRQIARQRENLAKQRATDAVNLGATTVPGGGGGRTKEDIVFDSLKRQELAQQSALLLGERHGQLQFDQAEAVIKLNEELRHKQATLTAGQKQELQTIVEKNAELKIRNTLEASVRDFNRNTADGITLLGLDTQARARYTTILQVENKFKEAGLELDFETFTQMALSIQKLQDLQNEEEVLNDVYGDRAKVIAKAQAAQRLFQKGQIDDIQLIRQQAQANIELRQGQVSIEAGASNALDKLTLEVTDFAKLTEDSIVGAFHAAEDALVSFATTGKLSLHSLFQGIEADLARLLIRKYITGAIVNALGGAIGSSFGASLAGGATGPQFGSGDVPTLNVAPTNIGHRAAGGPVEAGRPYWVGEHGPELFRPSVGGGITPNGAAVGGMGPITIINVLSKEEMDAAIADPRNGQAIVNHIGRNRAVTRQVLKLT